VLPFVNGSVDPNAEYLGDGITESLINSLSQLPNLKVVSRDSAFRYKGRDADAETVGRELGIRAVLKGRVTQRGDNLAISAELIDATDNSHIWGQQYSRKPSDIFTLQQKITKEITKALRVRLTGEEEKRLAKQGGAIVAATWTPLPSDRLAARIYAPDVRSDGAAQALRVT
jgi:adenylate cyclase